MPALKTIRVFGNQLVAYFDDGTRAFARPTSNGHIFIVSNTAPPPGGGGDEPPVDPPPGGGGGDGTMIDPFPGHYDANDPFGNIRPAGNAHTGSDWGMPEGTPIPPVCNGTIITNEWNDTVGNYLCIQASNINPEPEYPAGTQVYIYYYHMVEPAPVAVGSTVAKGVGTAGFVGNTGTSSGGNHLHITISNSPSVFSDQGSKTDPFAFITRRLG
jgi:murein DD-endopeptidase MepM/ murein hydrolase activator NlpD